MGIGETPPSTKVDDPRIRSMDSALFQLTLTYALSVAVFYTLQKLPEVVSRSWLVEPPLRNDLVEQLSTSNQLEDNEDLQRTDARRRSRCN